MLGEFTGVKCTNRFNILFCKSNSNNDDDCDFNTPDEDSSSEKEGSDITKNNKNCMNVRSVINGLKAVKYTFVKSPGDGHYALNHTLLTCRTLLVHVSISMYCRLNEEPALSIR